MNIQQLKAICEAAKAEVLSINEVKARADFINTFNPTLVEKLLAVVEAAKEVVEVTLIEHPDRTATVIAADIPARLKAALAALEETE